MDSMVEVLIAKRYPKYIKKLILNRMPKDIIVNFCNEKEILKEIRKIKVLIPEHTEITKRHITAGKELKLIQCGIGYENVDLNAARSKGIYVSCAPDLNTFTVAEHTFCLIFEWCRKVGKIDQMMRNYYWPQFKISTTEVNGKILGVIGGGNIGRKVAQIGKDLGMKVIVTKKRKDKDGDDFEIVNLRQLLQESDFITIHVPLNKETKGMFTLKEFSLMKKNVFLINTSRGEIIKEKDLLKVLKNKQISGAALDVFAQEPLALNNPLRKLDNVILTPHIAGMTLDSLEKRYSYFSKNIELIINGKLPLNLIVK
jgi:phosphoglycerate dehydrogenase-like enzyme